MFFKIYPITFSGRRNLPRDCRVLRRFQGYTSEYHHETSGLLSYFDPLVRYCILRLRLKHPRWGPSRILLHLQKRSSLKGKALPNPGQIGRYLHQ